MRFKFYTFDTHISSFRSFPSLKFVSNYPDCLVTDKKITCDELTALDYERTGYMRLAMAMEDTARIDWLDVRETDVHAECSEDDADDDADRPAVPGTQQLHGLPLYALPANRKSGQGTRFSSNWINLNESVLTPPNMQARVFEYGLDEPVQAMDEMQNEESAQHVEQDVLTVTQDLDVNKEVNNEPIE